MNLPASWRAGIILTVIGLCAAVAVSVVIR